MEKLRSIRLYGTLGAKFGRLHRLAVNSTAEAVRALCVLLPGFEREMMTSNDRGVSYACFIGTLNIGRDGLKFPVGSNDDIRIAPVLQGAKRAGVFQAILGAVIVVASVVYGVYTEDWTNAGRGIVLGLGMALGGVVQLLSPQPRGLGTKDSPENGASYNFNGPVNTTAQGNPVPLLYGRMIVGSATISAGIFSEDQV